MAEFRRGDPAQLNALRSKTLGVTEDADLYSLVDTTSASLLFPRCSSTDYMGRESGMGRFVLCSERCTDNEGHSIELRMHRRLGAGHGHAQARHAPAHTPFPRGHVGGHRQQLELDQRLRR